MNPWSLIVRAVKPLKTEKGIRNYAERGGEFEVTEKTEGAHVGETFQLNDATVREIFQTIKVVYGPNAPAETKYFAL